MCVFIFSVASTWNILGTFLKVVTWLTLLVLYLVLYLCVLIISTLMSPFSVLSTSGITWVYASDVYAFISPIFIFGNFPFSWCNYWIFARLEILIVFFAGWTCCISSGYAYKISTLRGSEVLNGFDWDVFFIWVYSCFTCWSFSWYASLTGTLGGTAEGLIFWIFSMGISMLPCANLLFWLVGFLVLDSELHKLNPVRHELFHLWRKVLACWIVWGKLYCVWYSFCSCFWDVCLMEYLMFHCCSYVPAVFYMWCQRWYIVWPIDNYYYCPWRGQRCAVVIEFSKYVGVGWYMGKTSWLYEKI